MNDKQVELLTGKVELLPHPSPIKGDKVIYTNSIGDYFIGEIVDIFNKDGKDYVFLGNGSLPPEEVLLPFIDKKYRIKEADYDLIFNINYNIDDIESISYLDCSYQPDHNGECLGCDEPFEENCKCEKKAWIINVNRKK